MAQSISKKWIGLVALFAVLMLALCAFAPQQAYAQQGWNNNSKGYWYEYNAKGSYYKSGWKQIDGSWYYFQKNGYAKEGWLKDGKNWYYLQGWGNSYPPYMYRGGAQIVDGKGYYFASNGAMKANGWAQCWDFKDDLDGAVCWVYASKSGALYQGWKKISGKWYYFGQPGYEKYGYYSTNGWKTIGNADYYFDRSTAMVTGWKKIDGSWFYFANSGAMQASKWIGNYWLEADGAMATSKWVDGGKYYVDENGKWVKGKKK